MQGVIKAYDPSTGDGAHPCDTDLADYDLAAAALDGSIFRMLRQGQRVIFDVDEPAGDALPSAPRSTWAPRASRPPTDDANPPDPIAPSPGLRTAGATEEATQQHDLTGGTSGVQLATGHSDRQPSL